MTIIKLKFLFSVRNLRLITILYKSHYFFRISLLSPSEFWADWRIKDKMAKYTQSTSSSHNCMQTSRCCTTRNSSCPRTIWIQAHSPLEVHTLLNNSSPPALSVPRPYKEVTRWQVWNFFQLRLFEMCPAYTRHTVYSYIIIITFKDHLLVTYCNICTQHHHMFKPIRWTYLKYNPLFLLIFKQGIWKQALYSTFIL